MTEIELRAVTRATLRKLPKRLLRAAAKRAAVGDACFVTACAHPTAVDHTTADWDRFARRYGLKWDGTYIMGDSPITALSRAWEYDRAWFRRALRERLAA